jgi:protocatechuate 3,4-dioxygenase beta subunit
MRSIEIRLQSEAVVAGRVLDVKGAPVTNAEIRVRYRDVPPAFRGILETNLGGKPITNVDGAYRIQGIAPERGVLIQAVRGAASSAISAVVLQSGEKRQMDLVVR